MGHGGTGIAVSSDEIVNGDANNGTITANNVFDSSGGIDLTDPNPLLQLRRRHPCLQ